MTVGTWNSYYDMAVVVLAASYMCQVSEGVSIKAANTETALGNTEMDKASAEVVLSNAELDKCAAQIALADAALDSIAITAVTTACTNLKKYLDDNSNEDAAEMLKDITDDATNLRTAIVTAVNAMNTYLDTVATGDLDLATYGAKALVQSGVGVINAINTGARVAENYAALAATVGSRANARVQAALGYAQEAGLRLSDLRSHIETSQGYASIAATFAREAEAQIEAQKIYISEATGYIETAMGYANTAEGFRQNAYMFTMVADGFNKNALYYTDQAAKWHEMYVEFRNDAWTIIGAGPQSTGDTVVVKTSQR